MNIERWIVTTLPLLVAMSVVRTEAGAASAPTLPTVDIDIEITKFRDDFAHTGAVRSHAIRLRPNQHGNVAQGPIAHRPADAQGKRPSLPPGGVTDPYDWIHVMNEGAVLRFSIKPDSSGEVYLPVGIAFSRHDLRMEDADFATEWKETNLGGGRFPFRDMKINGNQLEITDRLPRPGVRDSKIYKFSIAIKRQSDGAIAILDPYVHNEN